MRAEVRNTATRVALFSVIYILVTLFFRPLVTALLPFLIAVLAVSLAERIAAPVSRLTRLPKTATRVVLSLLLWLFSLAALFFLARTLFSEAQDALVGITLGARNLALCARDRLPALFPRLFGEGVFLFETCLDSVAEMLSSLLFSLLGTLLACLPAAVAGLFVSLLATLLLSKDRERVASFLSDLVPDTLRPRLLRLRGEVLPRARKCLLGYLLLFLLTFSFMSLSLFFIGADCPLFCGFLISLVDILPVLGSGAILLPWSLLSLLCGDTGRAILLLLLWILFSLLRPLATARLVGRPLGISPLLFLVTFSVCFSLFGFTGLLIAPVAASLLSLLAHRAAHPSPETGKKDL